MFPEDVELPVVAETFYGGDGEATAASDSIGNSLAFDYEKKRFVLCDGANKIPSMKDAVAQWIELFILTEKGKYQVYDDDFGTDFSDLMGYRSASNGYRVSEVIRRMTEGILKGCPAVDSVTDWSFKNGDFEFTVNLKNGEEVVING